MWDGVALSGVVHHTLVAGNRILEAEFGAIDFFDPLRGTLGVTIVNNTPFRNLDRGLGIFDDHGKGEAFLECKQVRFQSNLILEHGEAVDQVLLNHKEVFGANQRRETSSPYCRAQSGKSGSIGMRQRDPFQFPEHGKRHPSRSRGTLQACDQCRFAIPTTRTFCVRPRIRRWQPAAGGEAQAERSPAAGVRGSGAAGGCRTLGLGKDLEGDGSMRLNSASASTL